MLQTQDKNTEQNKLFSMVVEDISVLMPMGMIGFDTIQHYKLFPLFPEKENWVYWRLLARDFSDSEILPEERLAPKEGSLSFILMVLEDLQIGEWKIPEEEILKQIAPLGVRYEECLFFLVVSIEKDEAGKMVTMTANIKAPVVYHHKTNQAWQVILNGGEYPISFPLMFG